jgi:hypothetical protein
LQVDLADTTLFATLNSGKDHIIATTFLSFLESGWCFPALAQALENPEAIKGFRPH